MINYILPFLTYAIPLLFYSELSYMLKTLSTLILLIIFYKSYEIKWKINLLTIIISILISASWLVNYLLFPVTSELPNLTIKIISFLIVAPLIEELFIRHFFLRTLSTKDWKNYTPKFMWLPFIITTLIFGLAHKLWIAGLISGVLLNLLYYREKEIGPCIISHSLANLILLILALTAGFNGLL